MISGCYTMEEINLNFVPRNKNKKNSSGDDTIYAGFKWLSLIPSLNVNRFVRYFTTCTTVLDIDGDFHLTTTKQRLINYDRFASRIDYLLLRNLFTK